jgi:hypothetical protein
MKDNRSTKERGLVLPKNFVESYLNDLTDEEQLGIINAIFTWYMTGEAPEIQNKMVRVLFNTTLGFLESSKKSYEDGKTGGAPKGNNNAKKTTPLVLENNPPYLQEQPPLKNETTLREEKRKEEKRKEEKLEDNINEINFFNYTNKPTPDIEDVLDNLLLKLGGNGK